MHRQRTPLFEAGWGDAQPGTPLAVANNIGDRDANIIGNEDIEKFDNWLITGDAQPALTLLQPSPGSPTEYPSPQPNPRIHGDLHVQCLLEPMQTQQRLEDSEDSESASLDAGPPAEGRTVLLGSPTSPVDIGQQSEHHVLSQTLPFEDSRGDIAKEDVAVTATCGLANFAIRI